MKVWDGEIQSGAKVKFLIAAVIINKKGIKEFEDCLYLNPDSDLAHLADINLEFLIDKADKIDSEKK